MNIEKTNVNYAEIQEKLRAMKGLAEKRISAGHYWFEVNGNKRYVRINSDNFRAVSLDAHNPCGHLIRDEKEVGRKILESALIDARDVHCKNHLPGNTKPEHRVQAFIIWQALTDSRGLPQKLGIENIDALWFVTDELSLPPIRADLIMLGERGGRYFPVFIELKDGRTTEVAAQLKIAYEIASKVDVEFREFLSAATGKPVEAIHMESEQPMLVVIWGSTSRERPEAKKMRESGNLLTVCHEELGGKGEYGYGEFKFSLTK